MKKKVVGIIIILCILAAAALVIIRVTRNAAENAAEQKAAQLIEMQSQAVACVAYADTYLSLDLNGVVVNNESIKPLGIPQITGITFEELVFGKKAITGDSSGLAYALKVAVDLEKNNIRANEIRFASGTITVMIDRLEVRLGRNDKTDDKINDLADFVDTLIGKSGVLSMQNANANNYGYTFRENYY